jgi:hypothetical protein
MERWLANMSLAQVAMAKANEAKQVVQESFSIIESNYVTELGTISSQIDLAVVDTKIGTSVQSTIADDYIVEITKIEGATTSSVANPTPDNPSIITSASNFNIVASNSDGSKSNQVDFIFELVKLPNNTADTAEIGTDLKLKTVKRTSKRILNGTENWTYDGALTNVTRFKLTMTATDSASVKTTYCTHFKHILNGGYSTDEPHYYIYTNSLYIFIEKSRLAGWTDVLTDTQKISLFKTWLTSNNVTLLHGLVTPVENIISDIKLTSYKGITNITTTANPQVNITANFKARLSNTYEVLNTTKANVTQSSITTPTFTNLWVSNSSSVGYYKNSLGNVVFVGSIKSGTIGSSAFTLPIGFRPLQQAIFQCVSNSAFGYVVVNIDGTVIPYGNNTSISLYGISFRTDV